MNNLYNLETLHPSKKEIKSLAKAEAEKYATEGKEAMPDFVKAKRIIDYLTEFCSNVKDQVVSEREVYAKTEEVRVYGATVSIMEAGTRYDYSKCNDPEWNELEARIKELTELKKKREKLLMALPGRFEYASPEDGEVYILFPPKKTSTTSPKVEY